MRDAHGSGGRVASEWRIAKSRTHARKGLVTAEDRHAAEAGLSMLLAGGNAVDAAVAAAFVMGVVQPMSSGVGGVACMLIRTANGRVTAIDGSAVAPDAARPDMYELSGTSERMGIYGWPATKGNENNAGYRSLAVPGAVACLFLALQRYGSLKPSEVLAPAIALARDGFECDWYVGLSISSYWERLSTSPSMRTTFFRRSGAPLRVATGFEPGDRLVQPQLAETLQALAIDGADAFYRGPIAERIIADIAAHGGLVTAGEFARYEAREIDPLTGTFRDTEISTMPGASGGVTVLETLHLIDRLPPPADEVARRHLTAEALRRSFVDRFAFLADPDTLAEPFDALLTRRYAEDRMRTFDPERATVDIAPGDLRPAAGLRIPAADHTTHLCAVDQAGNAVSLTSTLGQGFGSAVMPAGTGVVMCNAMTWFDPVPGRVNSIAPGKRILWAAGPTFVSRAGKLAFVVGASGGRRIISAVPQVVTTLVEQKADAHLAASAPRLHCEDETTVIDARVDAGVRAALASMGHRVETREESFFSSHFGRAMVIGIRPDGTLSAGLDDLKPAAAAGH